jgi:hypothetical protein
MTSGMLAPTGTLSRLNFPSGPVRVVTSGEPEAGAPHISQLTPALNGSTVPLGM